MFKEVVIYSFLISIVLVISYICNVLLEMAIFIGIFYFVKALFPKQFHADSIAKTPAIAIALCYCITFFIQISFIFILIHFNISFYLNIYASVVLGILSYILQDYLDLKFPKARFYKGMKLDDIPSGLVGIERNIVELYYVKRYKIDKIAYELGYSVDGIKKIKSKIIKRYS